MDANVQIMQTLQTRDKQDFVHSQKYSLLMAAVQSRTITVARVLNGTDTLRKTARTFTWGSQRPMHGVQTLNHQRPMTQLNLKF
jgi:hypothetical protein